MRGKHLTIGVFVSSPSIDDNIKKLATQEGHVLRVSYQSLEKAISEGKRMKEEGVEVVVSRRGTAHLLRENLRIPVLSFPQSSLSILRSHFKTH